MRMMFQTRPSADELSELRGSVLQQIDTNRDGKIELGEFARCNNNDINSIILILISNTLLTTHPPTMCFSRISSFFLILMFVFNPEIDLHTFNVITRWHKTANITKDDITSQHIDI